MYVAARSYLATGVAVVGTSALAISPLSPVSTPLPDITVPAISSAAVELTSLANPLELWVQVLTQAVDNAGALGRDWLSDPTPILRQLATNQIGYIESVAAAANGVVAGLGEYFSPDNPYGAAVEIEKAKQLFAAGNIGGAVSTLTGALITGTIIVGIGLPLFESGVLDIPAKIAQNAADVVTAMFSLTTALPLLTGALGPLINPINALGDTAQDIIDSVQAGDLISAVTAVVNIPAVMTGALLNGFQAADGTFLPGLLSLDSFAGGLAQGLFITLPRAIADALGANASLAKTAATDEVSATEINAAATVTLDVPDATPALVSEPAEEAAAPEPSGAAPAVPAVDDEPAEEPVAEEEPAAEDPTVEEEAPADEEAAEEEPVDEETPADEEASEETEAEAPEEDSAGDDTGSDDSASDTGSDDSAGDTGSDSGSDDSASEKTAAA